jgi:hypothetical protein
MSAVRIELSPRMLIVPLQRPSWASLFTAEATRRFD